jgi:uncharacterized membrane protein YedE/YeeE
VGGVMLWVWVVVGVFIWCAILFVAACFGKAAAKPWPDQIEQFRKDPNE